MQRLAKSQMHDARGKKASLKRLPQWKKNNFPLSPIKKKKNRLTREKQTEDY